MEGDHVEIALLKQALQQDEERIDRLEKRVSLIDRKVLTGQIGLVVLIAMGTFVGWVVSISSTVRTWFH